MILTRIQIRDSRRLLIITFWLNDVLRGNLVSFFILWCSNFCFIQTWYHHSFCLGMDFFCNWTLSTRLLEKQADCQSRMHELYRGVWEHVPPEIFLKIGLSETPYPAFPGSNAINSYVYLVGLFSESRYSWFPSRSTKIHDSQVFKTKIHDSYMFCNYDSWFMIPLLPPRESNVWKTTRRRKSWVRFNFYVYAWLSIQYVYFKYTRKINMCTRG